MISKTKKKMENIYNRIDKIAVKGKDSVYDYYKLVDEFLSSGDYSTFEETLYHYYYINTSFFADVSEVKKGTWDKILFYTSSTFSKKLKKLYTSKNVYQIGYEVFGDSINYLSISVSNPMTSTYSISSSTQSVSFVIQSENIYLSTNDLNVYKINISGCNWDGDQPITNTINFLQTVGLTQSVAYRTEIPTSHGREYLINTYSKFPGLDLNYKLSITNENLLGEIKEIEYYTQDVKYYIENKQYAKIKGAVSTNLEVTKLGTYSVIIDTTTSKNEEQNLIGKYRLAIDYLLL